MLSKILLIVVVILTLALMGLHVYDSYRSVTQTEREEEDNTDQEISFGEVYGD